MVGAAGRAVAGLLVPLIALLAGAPPGAAEDTAVEPLPAEHAVAHNQFTFAYRLLQLGEIDTAARAFDEFLGHFPEDEKLGDALYFRGLIAWMRGNSRTATWYLGKVSRTAMVPDSDVLLLRGQIAYATEEFEAALGHMSGIDPATLESTTVAANVFLTRAACYQRLGNHHAAESELKRAAEIDAPVRARALLDLARVQRQLKKEDAALASLDAALALRDPAVTPRCAWLAGELLAARQSYASAVERYGIVLDRYAGSPHFGGAVLGTLWCQIKLGQYEQMLRTLAQYHDGLDEAARVTASDLAATAHQAMGDHERAIARLKTILTSAPGSPIEDRVQYRLARSQFELGAYDAMAVTLQRLGAAHPDSPHCQDGDLLLASAEARRSRPDRAEAAYTKIVTAGDRHPHYAQALVQRGWLYESRGQIEAAIADYERIQAESLARDPAQVHDVALRLISLYARAGRHEQSAEQARRLLGWQRPRPAAPLDPLLAQRVLFDLAHNLIRLGQHEEAHAVFVELLTAHALSAWRPQALYYDAMVLMSLDRKDEAVVRFGAALACEQLELPQRINALRLSALHLRSRRQDDSASQMLLLIDELSDRRGLQAEERLWLGRYLEAEGRYDFALQLLAPLTGRDPAIVGSLREEAVLITARCCRGRDDPESALAAYEQVIAMAGPLDLVASEERADTLREMGRYDAALQEYEGLLNRPETGVAARATFHSAVAHRALAGQRRRESDLPGAKRSVDRARRLLLRLIILYAKPQLSPLPELAHIELAEIEAELGDESATQRRFVELAEKFPDGPFAAYARAMLARHQGEPGPAAAQLRQLDIGALDARLAGRVRAQLAELGVEP